MTGINHIAHCHANLVTMTARVNSYCFVLSCIEFIFGIEVPWDNRHQPHTLLLW